MTMTETREWPYWEDWEFGWQVIDGRLHFEGEDIEHMLPPHLPAFTELQPRPQNAPFDNSNSDGVHWHVEFMFENGWHVVINTEWGVALNPATLSAMNRRAVPKPGDHDTAICHRWNGVWCPFDDDRDMWEDHGIALTCQEHEAIDYELLGYENGGYLAHPDHLLGMLAVVATFASDPEVRRRELAQRVP